MPFGIGAAVWLLLLVTAVAEVTKEGVLDASGVLGGAPGDGQDALRQRFSAWASRHHKSYAIDGSRANSEEFEHRLAVFADNVARVEAYNAQHRGGGEATMVLRVNAFADLTHAEFVQRHLSWRSSGVAADSLRAARLRGRSASRHGPANLRLPSFVNWTAQGVVSPVRDQLFCGSCWSFAAVQAIESAAVIFRSSPLYSLSAQQLVDCCRRCDGCAGGAVEDAFDCAIASDGVDTEAQYPYQVATYNVSKPSYAPFACRQRRPTAVRVQSWDYASDEGDELGLQKTVAVQPQACAIDASADEFQYYAGGIYSVSGRCGTRTEELNHAMLIVGYGTLGDGQDYWLIKNTWGPDWGLQGYMLMPRNRSNYCGVATDALYPIL